MAKIRAHIFRGTRWRLGRVKQRGELGGCEGPHVPGREIDIPADGDTENELSTIIHEALHACLWDIDEEAIDTTADDIARLLWRLGWRNE